MGLKHTREYTQIIDELTKVLESFVNLQELFQMNLKDWTLLSKDNQLEILSTLSDDIFYALGSENEYIIGNQKIKYNEENKSIDIFINEQLKSSISLYI
ncbi:MAG: hypothetical protein H7Y18_12010 [Clostridiaceae bacterium]|nr:hypothetical protein [Clostridiaceae bacterium]